MGHIRTALAALSATAIVAMLAGTAACGGPGADSEGDKSAIAIGVLSDLSGATADVGTPYSEGIRGYADRVNAAGGIEGRKLDLKVNDYAYKVDRAEQLYSQYVNQGVVAVQGWGTGDTEALRQKITQDKLPFMSASYSANLVKPSVTPYNFVIGTTYSDQMRIALKWIAEDSGGTAEVAVLHHDSPFGQSPLADGEAYLKEKGLKLGYRTYPMPTGATDHVALLNRAKAQGARYLVIQNVSSPAAVVAKNIKQQGLDMKIVCLNWCGDEQFIKLAGDAAAGHVMVQPFTPPTVQVSGHADPAAYLQSKGQSLTDKGLHYVQGWYTMHVMAEAIRKVIKDGTKVTGENLKAALEVLPAVDTGQITVPIDFSADSHAGMPGSSIYRVDSGKMAEIAKGVTP